MKKILAIDQGEYMGGAELIFSELLTRVDEDFEIDLITGSNQKYLERYQNSKVKVHQEKLPKLKKIRISTYRKFRKTKARLEKLLREIKPDLIISNTVRTHLLISALAKKLNIPLVWMAHDRTFPKLILRWFIRYPKLIIPCSNYIQRYYHRVDKKLKVAYRTIYPFGIDAELIDQLSQVKKESIIGMVGKFIPWKAHDNFIRMAARIHLTHPDYRFEIIGSVYEDDNKSELFFKKCQFLVKELNLKEVLTIRASTNAIREIAKWRILVHCSKEPEPLGRVVLEGMAVGCGVVASKLGGPSEIVEDRETGLLANPKVRDLSNAVEKYIKKPKLLEKVSKNAQIKIRKEFVWDKVVNKFKQALDGGR